jgi:hypothetical protein
MQLVRKIAWQIHGRVRDVFEIDDLVQIGMVALVEAAKRFQDLGQASFSSYAAVRIRGALTDHLRKNLTLTRLGVQRRAQINIAELAVKAAGGDPANRELVAAELGISVASVGVRGEPTGAPGCWNGDVVATAKRDLKAGELLDGEGGYTVYGKLMPATDSLAVGGLPLGLAHGVKLKRAVKAGQPVSWSDVAFDAGNEAVKFRREMEKVFAPKPAGKARRARA